MSFTINGSEPDIIGKYCEGFYLIQHQESQSITDQANTVYLKFSNNWVKHYFDGNTIFWRKNEKPKEPENNTLNTCLVLINLCEFEGVVGHNLEGVEYNSSNDHVGTTLNFSSGKELKLKHHIYNDYTTIYC